MKKFTLGLVIGISLSLGVFSLASSEIILVRVPEYVNGYKTTDLLQFVSEQVKERDELKAQELQYEADIKSGKIKEKRLLPIVGGVFIQ